MTRPKSVAVAFLAGALLVGGLLGFTAERVVFREKLCDRTADPVRLRDRLAAELGLAPAQRAAVDSLLDVREVRRRAVMAPVQPLVDSVYHLTRDEIRQVLTPEQRRRFEDFITSQSNAGSEKR